jgi:hypothetical protein
MFKVTFINYGVGTYGVPVCFTLRRETDPQKEFDIVRTMVGSLTLKLCYDNLTQQVPWCADAYKFLHFLNTLSNTFLKYIK